MRDLRKRWVFPRLLYYIALHSFDRFSHKLFAIFFDHPSQRLAQFFGALRDNENVAVISLAAVSAFAALIRAYALLLVAMAILLVAIGRI